MVRHQTDKDFSMNQNTDRKDTSGPTDPLLVALQAVVGTYPPNAEQAEKNKARKAELDFQLMKRRADRRERRLAELKEKARQKLRGGIDHE
jgi:hypothetical protein